MPDQPNPFLAALRRELSTEQVRAFPGVTRDDAEPRRAAARLCRELPPIDAARVAVRVGQALVWAVREELEARRRSPRDVAEEAACREAIEVLPDQLAELVALAELGEGSPVLN